MARLPLRRVLFGFAVGAAAGWFAGLLRTPATAPAGTSAGLAPTLPQEDFGRAPAEAEAPLPVDERPAEAPADEAPAVEPVDVPDSYPAEKPVGRRRKPATPAPAAVGEAAAEELRAGHAEASEKLDDAEIKPAPAPDPKARRRKPRQPKQDG